MRVENNLTETIDGLKWSILRLAMTGQKECGDRYYIKSFNNKIILAAIDGLGHGKEAVSAGKKLIRSLDYIAPKTNSIVDLIKYCHEKLKDTRGAVMNIASISNTEKTLSWIGIGNINGVFYHWMEGEMKPSTFNIMQQGGILGYELPPLKVSALPINFGDTVIFTTDGLSYTFANDLNLQNTTNKIASFIGHKYIKRTDDALILVARYVGK